MCVYVCACTVLVERRFETSFGWMCRYEDLGWLVVTYFEVDDEYSRPFILNTNSIGFKGLPYLVLRVAST